jgi:3-deoxy-manno-octulosonate cytidylyltransferase (CMP-KDO synthetase)
VALIVIPARMGATRLPGKPLLAETGKPLVVHVLEAVRHCTRAARVVVATDDDRIAAAVRAAWGEAIMTSPECRSGTDRAAEAAARLPGEDLVVNVQGDEPEIESAALDALIAAMEGDLSVEMGTLAAPILSDEELAAPSVVKVVTDSKGNALYFSRAPIPFQRDPAGTRPQARAAQAQPEISLGTPLRHVGAYAYRRAFLARFAAMDATPLERTEGLEQLRALENGVAVRVVRTDRAPAGIDTREDYDAFVRRWRERKV